MFEIRYFGDPILRKTAKPIEVFDEKLAAFANDMIEALKREEGVGLAANQIGVSIRMIVIDASGGEKDPIVLINPELLWSSEEREDYDEGCLSVPDVTLKVNRPSRVTVRAHNLKGEQYTIENADGLLARALQHEIDHLNGILFIDHVSPLQRQMLSGKLKKITREAKEKSKAA